MSGIIHLEESSGSCSLFAQNKNGILIINQIVVDLIHIQLNIKLIQPGLLFFQLVLLGEGTL